MDYTIFGGYSVAMRVTVDFSKSWNHPDLTAGQLFDQLIEQFRERPSMETLTEIEKTESGGSFVVQWEERSGMLLAQQVQRAILNMNVPEEAFTITHAKKYPYIPPDAQTMEAQLKRWFGQPEQSNTEE